MAEGQSETKSQVVTSESKASTPSPAPAADESAADRAKASRLSKSLVRNQLGAGGLAPRNESHAAGAGHHHHAAGKVGAKANTYDTTVYTLTPAAKGLTQATVDKKIKAKQASKPAQLGPKVSIVGKGLSAQGKIYLSWIIAQLGSRARWGTESDLVAEIGPAPKAGGARPRGQVTLRIDGQGNATVELVGKAPPTVSTKFKTIAEGKKALCTTYGFSSVVDAGANWTVPELEKCAASFALLSGDERAALAGVVLRRTHTLTLNGKSLNGLFQHKEEMNKAGQSVHEATLSLADGAFSGDKVSFVGGKKGSAPASRETILHEVGHAVETHARRAATVAYNDAAVALNQANAELAAKAKPFNKLGPTVDSAAKTAIGRLRHLPHNEQHDVRGYWRAINRYHSAINKAGTNKKASRVGSLLTAMDHARAACLGARNKLQAKHPKSGGLSAVAPLLTALNSWRAAAIPMQHALEAWQKAKNLAGAKKKALGKVEGSRGKGKKRKWFSNRLLRFEAYVKKHNITPLTDYAKTSGEEFFAESFSLWKSDPEYMAANRPKLKQWFDSGEHLKP